MKAKNSIIIMFVAVLLFVLSGCNNTSIDYNSNESAEITEDVVEKGPENVSSDTDEVIESKGKSEVFEYGELVLEVSNVKEIMQGSSFDGMETWTHDIFVVYPKAEVKVLSADTFLDEESGLQRADWAFLTYDNKRIDINDDSKPIEITTDLLGVYDPESSVYVLKFEIVDTD